MLASLHDTDINRPCPFVATVAALFTCGAALIANSATAAAATPAVAATAVSTIQSVSQRTCLDIAAAASGSNFLDTYGHRCNTAITQQFAFHPLPVASTYEITNQSSGKCIDQYPGPGPRKTSDPLRQRPRPKNTRPPGRGMEQPTEGGRHHRSLKINSRWLHTA